MSLRSRLRTAFRRDVLPTIPTEKEDEAQRIEAQQTRIHQQLERGRLIVEHRGLIAFQPRTIDQSSVEYLKERLRLIDNRGRDKKS